MKCIYVFGNEYLKEDNLALKIAKRLKNFKLVICRSPDELLEAKGKEILILDVLKNVKKPLLIKDISQIKTRKIISLHDFDLGFFLKLMGKIKDNKKIKIIGVPSHGNPSKLAKEVKACISKI